MPEGVLVFEFDHPVDGALRFFAAADSIHIDCRWPFDLDTNDWVFIGNDVDITDYRLCLDRLSAGHEARVDGLTDGFVTFTPISSTNTQVEVCDSAAHAPARLALIVPEDATSLATRLRDALAGV